MIEVEITCECPAIQLADLQMALTRGMVVYLAEGQARGSPDLQRAVRAKGVTVKYVQRFREQRAPGSPVVAATKAVSVPGHTSLDGAVSPLPPSGGSLDQEALAQRIAEIVTSKVLGVLNQALATRQEANFPGLSDGVGYGVGSNHPRVVRPVVPDDIPVFIPSKIGRDDLHPADVKATEGEAGSVSDAVAALRAARKGNGK